MKEAKPLADVLHDLKRSTDSHFELPSTVCFLCAFAIEQIPQRSSAELSDNAKVRGRGARSVPVDKVGVVQIFQNLELHLEFCQSFRIL
eukprot:SAG31_NODE_41568_length_275_cov_0.886364_1_plen_88_part_01